MKAPPEIVSWRQNKPLPKDQTEQTIHAKDPIN